MWAPRNSDEGARRLPDWAIAENSLPPATAERGSGHCSHSGREGEEPRRMARDTRQMYGSWEGEAYNGVRRSDRQQHHVDAATARDSREERQGVNYGQQQEQRRGQRRRDDWAERSDQHQAARGEKRGSSDGRGEKREGSDRRGTHRERLPVREAERQREQPRRSAWAGSGGSGNGVEERREWDRSRLEDRNWNAGRQPSASMRKAEQRLAVLEREKKRWRVMDDGRNAEIQRPRHAHAERRPAHVRSRAATEHQLNHGSGADRARQPERTRTQRAQPDNERDGKTTVVHESRHPEVQSRRGRSAAVAVRGGSRSSDHDATHRGRTRPDKRSRLALRPPSAQRLVAPSSKRHVAMGDVACERVRQDARMKLVTCALVPLPSSRRRCTTRLDPC